MMIVVLGPDGSGKSSLIAALARTPGRPVTRFHLRPGVIAGGRDAARGPVSDAHGQSPRGLLASVAKLLFLLADYVLGYWLVVRPVLAAGGMAIFDRYYHDLLVDPRRYRYGGPMWLARALGAVVPDADLWIVLDAPTDVLQARKQDVSAAETARQREAYRELARELDRAVIVDATQPLVRVTADVERAIANRAAHEFPMRHGYEHR